MFRKVLKTAAVLACSAGIFAGCANSLTDAEWSSETGSARATSGTRIYATVTANPSDRVQFRLDLGSTKISKDSNNKFTFYVSCNGNSALPSKDKFYVRDGAGSYTKWDTSVSSLITGSTDYENGWHKVTVTVPSSYSGSTSKLGFTYGESLPVGKVIAVKDIKFGTSSSASAISFSQSSWSTFESSTSVKFTCDKPSEWSSNPGSSGGSSGSGSGSGSGSSGSLKWAGFRFSNYGIIDKHTGYSYKNDGLPNGYQLPVYRSEDSKKSWEQNLKVLKNASGASKAAIVFIVGTVHSSGKTSCEYCKDRGDNYHDQKNDICELEFSKPSGVSSSSILKFKNNDSYCDKLMTFCNNNNIDVWLQVEPGDNDPIKLAQIVLNRFKSNKCVVGFGLDNEWWKRHSVHKKGSDGKQHPMGRKLKDQEAADLVTAVRNIKSSYRVFAKHWETEFMPPSYRDGMVFVTDSQDYSSLSTFEKWAKAFKGYPIVFQVGYPADDSFWNNKEEQFIKDLINIGKQYSSDFGIVWVDFTMKEFVNDLKSKYDK